ncbi:UbiA prenyltransferase family protein [Flavivirga spongiicola]|uniref:UbiA prenyltransferase family protein n=1 Tax=Flavivirga spongiicola TaxID=421621 RepID=A0ABU7XYK8_9FLAO|nr:UbiA prenyltransferase family protein [Flavivirga sp. MEBiC05379]MDO5980495.1 UbiA prenyltransferase family protein [Flavivirga sp. MEBiC05379]
MILQTLKLIRIHHWVKNIAVFLPVFFSGQFIEIFDDNSIYKLVILFFAFCFASSIIYIINDSIDVDKDRLHPVKSLRPIASGFFTKKQAFFIAGVFFIVLSYFLFLLEDSIWFVVSYFILNILYSFKLKNIAIIDVTCVSLGFLLRILAGGFAIGVIVSQWMTIIVFLLSMSIAFAKRRDDLTIKNDNTILRKSQSGYSIAFIDIAKGICFSITLIAYIMYSISTEVIERLGTDKLYTTSLFVFIGIMRYLQISVVENKSGSPIKILSKDIFLQLVLLCWILLFTYFIYF